MELYEDPTVVIKELIKTHSRLFFPTVSVLEQIVGRGLLETHSNKITKEDLITMITGKINFKDPKNNEKLSLY